MAKRVKVVLTESVATLGRDGDVVEVAPGYARNFLLPFEKAANVTPSINTGANNPPTAPNKMYKRGNACHKAACNIFFLANSLQVEVAIVCNDAFAVLKPLGNERLIPFK